jgi:hypothetical protein
MIDRDIILDLLPLYRAGLGSPTTRALVAAWLAEHPELDGGSDHNRDGEDWRDTLARARRIARWRRWTFGIAIALTVICLAIEIDLTGHPPTVRLLALKAPLAFAPIALAAIVAWIAYWLLRRKSADR